jgi:hypothetical protein
MKSIFIVMLFYFSLLSAWAGTLPLKSCTALQDRHLVQFQQINRDVQIILEDSTLRKYGNIDINGNEKYKISGKSISIIVIDSVELSDFIKNPNAPQKILSSIMYGRPEYSGEDDMVYSYAEDFVRALICQ